MSSKRTTQPEAVRITGLKPKTGGLPGSQASSTPNESDLANQKLAAELSGTEDLALAERLVAQATGAVTDYMGMEMNMAYALAALRGIGPQDGLEGLVASQLVGMYSLTMELMSRAALKGQTDLGVEVNLNRAIKASGAFVRLMDALSRYRGKGEQKMTVEHVHVHKGGQAIVGAVSQSNRQTNRKVRRDDNDSK
jgi:hypothetical protein